MIVPITLPPQKQTGKIIHSCIIQSILYASFYVFEIIGFVKVRCKEFPDAFSLNHDHCKYVLEIKRIKKT